MKLDHVNKEKLETKTKAFFRSENWKNLLVFFTFVVLAFLFWMLRYYQQNYILEDSIPMEEPERVEHLIE